MPTAKDLRIARRAYERAEPRDLFYKVATELITHALEGSSRISVAEALGVLLQTWNRSYYRFRGGFTEAHFKSLEYLLSRQGAQVGAYRARAIETFDPADEQVVGDLFQAFEAVLGPVGASKSLNLLAPSFFPIWDRRIAYQYVGQLGATGTNGSRYVKFMTIARDQAQRLGGDAGLGRPALKALDEYNYVRYTLRLEA